MMEENRYSYFGPHVDTYKLHSVHAVFLNVQIVDLDRSGLDWFMLKNMNLLTITLRPIINSHRLVRLGIQAMTLCRLMQRYCRD